MSSKATELSIKHPNYHDGRRGMARATAGRWFHVSARIVIDPWSGLRVAERPGVTYRRGDKPRNA